MERSIIASKNMPAMMMAMEIHEVHCNTLEGLWAALRTFLRPFRGVHKRYLAQYVAIFALNGNTISKMTSQHS